MRPLKSTASVNSFPYSSIQTSIASALRLSGVLSMLIFNDAVAQACFWIALVVSRNANGSTLSCLFQRDCRAASNFFDRWKMTIPALRFRVALE